MKSIKTLSKKAQRITALCLITAVFVIGAVAIPFISRASGASAEAGVLLSPGLSVLAEENSMAMAGLKGREIRFEAADFARAMNMSRVESIVVTSVPPVTDGELRVGTTVLGEGQTVSGSNLSLLVYAAKSDVAASSFRFRVEGSPVEMTCHLFLLDRYNASPTVSLETGVSSDLYTHKGTALYGTLPCSDPEGDEIRVEIVSYPTSGSILLTDPATGRYTYVPAEDVTGEDSFTYVVRDQYGNYSDAATVQLEIIPSESSVYYTDMKQSPYANAAISMTDAGIMSGTQIGNELYFRPDTQVSRAEFTKMAMCALGMTEVAYDETVFADNGEIPAELRGYVSAAYELGYLNGIATEDGTLKFEPNRAITRAEAAVMLGGMLDLAAPTVTPDFSDLSDIPAWAAPSIYSLHAMGVFYSESGAAEPLAAMTRGDTAYLLTRLMDTVR